MKSIKPLHKEVAEETVAAPDAGLPGLIRFANLAPVDAKLPDFPDEKCARLGNDNFDDVAAEREFARFLDEKFPREKFAEFRDFFDAKSALLERTGPPHSTWLVYIYVKEAHEALRMIATHKRERSLVPGGWFFPWEQVGGWKLDRIRVCENCGKLFFANRKNKLTCSDPCSTARRVREWRKHQPQYEHARKLKLARPTKGTKTKTQKQKEPSPAKQGLQGGKNGYRKTQ